MKVLPLALVAVAAGGALWIALRAGDPTYAPPTAPEVVHAVIPEVLGSEPGPGEVVHAFAVEGMCCNGCPVKLHQLLAATDGVRVAAVSFEAGTASVIARADVPAEDLRALLTFDGYRAELREPALP